MKKNRKSIGYNWVSVAADIDCEGDDIRDTLNAVVKLAVDGAIVPHVPANPPLPFERAPEVFHGSTMGERTVLSAGRTAVIRVQD